MNWPFVVALTLTSPVYRTYNYKNSSIPVALAILSLPTLWVLYMGNIDGFVIVGLILLPWEAPLALMKPQIAGFALLARKSSIIVGVIWILISFVIWGFWPSRFLLVLTSDWKAVWTQEISLFRWGLLVALPLMWFSHGDEDLLMAAGSLVTPHLYPYHFIVLMPALGRMILTWLLTRMPLSAEWVGDIGWHAGNLVSLCFWFGIYLNKDSMSKNAVTKTLKL